MFRTHCKNLSPRDVVYCFEEINLVIRVIWLSYFSCLYSSLFLAVIFTTSSYLSLMHCIKFPALETYPSFCNEFLKYPHGY